MFDFRQLLNPSFWLAQAPLVSLSVRILWGIFGLFIILAIVSRLVIAMQKKNMSPWFSRTVRKLYKMFLTMGIIGLTLLFFGYEGIPYLSARLVYPIWILVVLIWLIYILVHVLKRLPQDRLAMEQQKKVAQYSPGK